MNEPAVSFGAGGGSDRGCVGPNHLLLACHRGLSLGLRRRPLRRPSAGQLHGKDSTTSGIKRCNMRRHKILILTAFLAPIGLISEGAAQAEGSQYTRLLLYNDPSVRQYELMKFTNATDVCNFFGARTKECDFANEYFAGWGGSYTATLEFYRFPTESSRAHIYVAGVAALSTPAQLAAALDAKGPAQWGDIDGLFRNRGRLHKPCRIGHIRADCVSGSVRVERFASYCGDNHRDNYSCVHGH